MPQQPQPDLSRSILFTKFISHSMSCIYRFGGGGRSLEVPVDNVTLHEMQRLDKCCSLACFVFPQPCEIRLDFLILLPQFFKSITRQKDDSKSMRMMTVKFCIGANSCRSVPVPQSSHCTNVWMILLVDTTARSVRNNGKVESSFSFKLWFVVSRTISSDRAGAVVFFAAMKRMITYFCSAIS